MAVFMECVHHILPGHDLPHIPVSPLPPQLGYFHLVTPSEHGSKWGSLGLGSTETEHICIPASICGILGREKRQANYEAGLRAGLGGHEVGLPRWPMPPRGDQTREFGHPIHELKAGAIGIRTITRPGES